MNVILAATDFSANGATAVKYAAHLALKLNCKLLILNVYHIPMGSETGQPVPPDVFADIEEGCNKNLLACENEIKSEVSDKLEIKRLVACGFAADEILAAAEQYKPGIIVMGAHGQSGLEKLFGSVTSTVLRKSEIPVLALPANAEYKAIEKVVIASHGMESISKMAKELFDSLTSAYHPKYYIADVLNGKTNNFAENQKQYGAFVFTRPEIITEETADVPKGIDNVVNKTGAGLLIMFPGKHSFLYRMMNIENTKKMAMITHIPLLAILKEGNNKL